MKSLGKIICSALFVVIVEFSAAGSVWAEDAVPSESLKKETIPSCSSEQAELFSCPLETKVTLDLCLNKDNLTTELVRVDPQAQGKKIVARISDLKQFINIRAHDYQTVLQGRTSDAVVTLFIDTNPYDMDKPVLTTVKSGQTNKEFCADSDHNVTFGPTHDVVPVPNYRIPTNKIEIKNESKMVSITNLLEIGVSAKLEETEVPDWPGTVNLKHHHPAIRKVE